MSSACAERLKLHKHKQKSCTEMNQWCMQYTKNRGRRKGLPNKRTKKKHTLNSNVVDVEAATSQDRFLHLENPATTVVGAIIMLNVEKRLRKWMLTRLTRTMRLTRELYTDILENLSQLKVNASQPSNTKIGRLDHSYWSWTWGYNQSWDSKLNLVKKSVISRCCKWSQLINERL